MALASAENFTEPYRMEGFSFSRDIHGRVPINLPNARSARYWKMLPGYRDMRYANLAGGGHNSGNVRVPRLIDGTGHVRHKVVCAECLAAPVPSFAIGATIPVSLI